MKNAHLGALEVSRIGLGAMTMAGTYTTGGALDHDESIRTIRRALDLGVTHIDTAEIYGPYLSEEIVGRAIKGSRDKVKIATKFGLVSHSGGGPGTIDSSPANVKAAVFSVNGRADLNVKPINWGQWLDALPTSVPRKLWLSQTGHVARSSSSSAGFEAISASITFCSSCCDRLRM